jgi:hypothetical protein
MDDLPKVTPPKSMDAGDLIGPGISGDDIVSTKEDVLEELDRAISDIVKAQGDRIYLIRKKIEEFDGSEIEKTAKYQRIVMEFMIEFAQTSKIIHNAESGIEQQSEEAGEGVAKEVPPPAVFVKNKLVTETSLCIVPAVNRVLEMFEEIDVSNTSMTDASLTYFLYKMHYLTKAIAMLHTIILDNNERLRDTVLIQNMEYLMFQLNNATKAFDKDTIAKTLDEQNLYSIDVDEKLVDIEVSYEKRIAGIAKTYIRSQVEKLVNVDERCSIDEEEEEEGEDITQMIGGKVKGKTIGFFEQFSKNMGISAKRAVNKYADPELKEKFFYDIYVTRALALLKNKRGIGSYMKRAMTEVPEILTAANLHMVFAEFIEFSMLGLTMWGENVVGAQMGVVLFSRIIESAIMWMIRNLNIFRRFIPTKYITTVAKIIVVLGQSIIFYECYRNIPDVTDKAYRENQIFAILIYIIFVPIAECCMTKLILSSIVEKAFHVLQKTVGYFCCPLKEIGVEATQLMFLRGQRSNKWACAYIKIISLVILSASAQYAVRGTTPDEYIINLLKSAGNMTYVLGGHLINAIMFSSYKHPQKMCALRDVCSQRGTKLDLFDETVQRRTPKWW